MKVVCHNENCGREGFGLSPFHLRKDGWKSRPGVGGGIWYCPKCNPPLEKMSDFYGASLLNKSLRRGIEN